MAKVIRVPFVLICCVMMVFACSKTSPQDPVAGADLVGIDPDQKAIPKDVPVQPKDTDEQAASAEGNQVSASEAQPAAVAAADPNVESVAIAAPPGESVSGPAAPESSSSSTVPTVVGSGPQTRFIKAATLNIRSQPNRYSKILGSLKGGDEVHVKIHDGWAKLDDGKWIRSRWLVKSRPRGFTNATDEDSVKQTRQSKSKSGKKKKRRKSK